MADIRLKIECTYCDAKFAIKFPENLDNPKVCCFCGEGLPSEDDEEDEEEYVNED